MAENQEGQVDPKFYERADAQISFANEQISKEVHPSLVNNSFMFSASRFNAWIVASSFNNGEEMKENREEVLEHFASQYRLMLEENFDSYAENYDLYMGISKEQAKK